MENEEKINENDKKLNKKKGFNLLSKLLKTTKSKIIFIISVILIIAILIIGVTVFCKEEKADFSYLNLLLEKSSELTTAKLKIRGIEKYEDAGAMIINRADFIMVYSATIRAGVELKEVKIEPNPIGKEIVIDLLKSKGYNVSCNYNDCGVMIFDKSEQDTHSGGSGCACIATTFSGYIFNMLKTKKYKKVLMVATGALTNATSSQQGESIPGIAHAISVEI